MGPTASGKTPLALALAQVLPVEIVSVDSAQIYRGMDVGTAKPSPSERGAAPHHLIDIIDPTQTYSAARFREDALRLMTEIAARRRIPLLVGGTMLYFKALREGLSDLPESDAEVRAEIDAAAAQRGWLALHAELAKIDPETAARLKPNDAQRIEERFDAMLERGLIEELRALRERYALRPGLPSMRCVGYRQAWQFLERELDYGELRRRGIFATRQLAKRQLTWLRATPGIQSFDCLDPAVAEKSIDFLRRETEAR